MAGKGAWAKLGMAQAEGNRLASNDILRAASQSYNRVIADGGSHEGGQMAARATARGMGMNPDSGHAHEGRDKAIGAAAHAKLKAPEPPKVQTKAAKPVRASDLRKTRMSLAAMADTTANQLAEALDRAGVYYAMGPAAQKIIALNEASTQLRHGKILGKAMTPGQVEAQQHNVESIAAWSRAEAAKHGQALGTPKSTAAPAAVANGGGERRANEARVVTDFAERRAARADRLQERSEKALAESDARHQAVRNITKYIPMGQPILVGHHSEKRARRDMARIDSNIGKSVLAYRKSKELARRAIAAKNNRAVSSDDPEAVRLLKDKLTKLEKKQEAMVGANKAIRAALGKKQDAVAVLVQRGFPEATARKLLEPDFAGRIGFPDYAIKNNSAEVRRVKQRVEALQAHRSAAPVAEKTINGISIHEGGNRVRLSFGGKPPDAVRSYLKSHGFKWAPSEGVWQRMTSSQAHYHAEEAAKMMGATAKSA